MKIYINNKYVSLLSGLIQIIMISDIYSQGLNSTWLMGHQSKLRMFFTSTTYNIMVESRTIPFFATQGNISDDNGNLLMSSNGIFVADATGDTMMNGGGLNPGQFTNDFKDYGLPMPNANIYIPMPENPNKFILFHQVANYNASVGLCALELYQSVIDLSLNNNLGGVVSKNNILLTGSFGWGLAACKHGNGRDWWVIALSDSAKKVYTFLVTPDSIQYTGLQILPIPGFPDGYTGQPVFSPDGSKFAFAGSTVVGMAYQSRVQLFDFNRCNGFFSLDTIIDFTDGNAAFATAFSPNSKYLYFSTTERIFQIDTDTSNIGVTYQLVALNDTFQSAPPNFFTNFYLMYLATNGKIYISSTSSVLHLHEMNYPDSIGTASDVQLHNILLPHFNTRTVPNHPTYYLGALTGSPCYTLGVGMNEIEHDFRFSVSPNPNNGQFSIMYLLPQNQKGKLEIFDINGRRIYEMNLPPWSTMQYLSLPQLTNGVYHCAISSGGERKNKKIVVFEE